MAKKTILVITDGIGHSPKTQYNAFYKAKKPTYDYLFANTPHCLLKTYGESVGLPVGQMGNSEVGHMCIGAGRVLYQDLVKINMAISDGSLAKSDALLGIRSCKNIHICSLLSDGGVHSHIDHTKALIKIAKSWGSNVFVHIFTDGRDVLPKSAISYINELEPLLDDKTIIATISGRYYGMDRDNRWDRVKLAYDAIAFGTPATTLSPKQYIQSKYDNGQTDEFITPTSFGEYEGIKEGDGVVFANFRNDRVRQIVSSLSKKDFEHFHTAHPIPKIVTMTCYDDGFDFPIIFPKEEIKNTLCEVIASNNLTQIHIAETEKYAHVTFFLNGGKEVLLKNESRVLIPSPKVATYDLCPQMSAKEVGDSVLESIKKGFDFIVVNFANGDMVGHTGILDASIKAVESVDCELGRIIKSAKESDYSMIITSDHGNCEEIKDDDGNTLTNHTAGEVWCFVISPIVKSLRDGALDNVAPSVLKLMGLEIPTQMSEALF